MKSISKPERGEFKASTQAYIELLPDDEKVLHHLQKHYKELKVLIKALPEEQLNYRYAEGKWNLKEMLVHLMDSERIFAVRALRIARNDQANLPGYQQDDYVSYSNADSRTSEVIFEEFDAARAATLSLFNSFSEKQLKRVGTADGYPVSVRALAYIIAGHQKHHINIIHERYL